MSIFYKYADAELLPVAHAVELTCDSCASDLARAAVQREPGAERHLHYRPAAELRSAARPVIARCHQPYTHQKLVRRRCLSSNPSLLLIDYCFSKSLVFIRMK